MSEIKKQWGGARKNAGRKPKDNVQLSLKIPTDLLHNLNQKFKTVKERNKHIIECLKVLTK